VVGCDGQKDAFSRSRQARKGIVLHRSIEQRRGEDPVFGKKHRREPAAVDPLRGLLRAERASTRLELQSDDCGGNQTPEQSSGPCDA
jgi:hypothetical protein